MKNKVVAGLLLSAMLVFSGCSSDKSVPVQKDSVASTEAKVEAEGVENYYPVTVENYNYQGDLVTQTFTKKPEKVVAVYQNSIETLLALGEGDLIVGSAGLDHEIKEAYKGNFNESTYYENGMTKEEVMSLSPDLIISWKSYFSDKKISDVDFWNQRDVNTYIMNNSGVLGMSDLENEYDDILKLGKIFNKNDQAEAIVKNIKDEISKGKAYAEGKTPVKALILECSSNGAIRNYGVNSIGGDVISQLGGDLLAEENGSLTAEEVANLNPDVIFTVFYSYYDNSVEKSDAISRLTENKGLQSVSAIQNDRIVPVKLGEVYCSGVRTMDAVQTMLEGLYPDEYSK